MVFTDLDYFQSLSPLCSCCICVHVLWCISTGHHNTFFLRFSPLFLSLSPFLSFSFSFSLHFLFFHPSMNHISSMIRLFFFVPSVPFSFFISIISHSPTDDWLCRFSSKPFRLKAIVMSSLQLKPRCLQFCFIFRHCNHFQTSFYFLSLSLSLTSYSNFINPPVSSFLPSHHHHHHQVLNESHPSSFTGH